MRGKELDLQCFYELQSLWLLIIISLEVTLPSNLSHSVSTCLYPLAFHCASLSFSLHFISLSSIIIISSLRVSLSLPIPKTSSCLSVARIHKNTKTLKPAPARLSCAFSPQCWKNLLPSNSLPSSFFSASLFYYHYYRFLHPHSLSQICSTAPTRPSPMSLSLNPKKVASLTWSIKLSPTSSPRTINPKVRRSNLSLALSLCFRALYLNQFKKPV